MAKALTPAQLKKQMKDARKVVRDAAEAIVERFIEKFGTNILPDHMVVEDEAQWDIDYDDEKASEQVVWLEDCGLYPSDCSWLWG